jgi:cytochrome c oxidase cbb3-type subunit 3
MGWPKRNRRPLHCVKWSNFQGLCHSIIEGNRRVPHVRQSVRGTKMMGAVQRPLFAASTDKFVSASWVRTLVLRHTRSLSVFVLALAPLIPLRAQPPGAAIFASNCAGCHGADGRGGEHAPNIATNPEVQHLMDRELAGIIRYGIAGAGMPAFSSLKPQEVADVVSYLRLLQGRGDIVKLPGDPTQGQALFFGKGKCSDCHMISGKGGFIGSDLSFYGADAKPDRIRAIILDPDKNLPADQKATTVVTSTGQKFTGMLKVNDNFSLSLQTLDGSFHFFPKPDLAHVDFGSRSLMPPSTLSGKEVDDVVSYLLQIGQDNAKQSPAHPSKSDDDDN